MESEHRLSVSRDMAAFYLDSLRDFENTLQSHAIVDIGWSMQGHEGILIR